MKTGITEEQTWQADLDAFRNEVCGLMKRRAEYIAALKAAEAKRFKDAGGCEKCHGRGWVVVWDTLDCMDGSCADYGSCPNPNCTAEKRGMTGIDISVSLRHDRWKNVDTESMLKALPAYKAVVSPADRLLDNSKLALETLERKTHAAKGTLVVVTKGKSNVGSRGRVAFIKDAGTEGAKVLIKDPAHWENRKADGVWAYARNVVVLKEGGK